jgi:hypothetical protein
MKALLSVILGKKIGIPKATIIDIPPINQPYRKKNQTIHISHAQLEIKSKIKDKEFL